MMFSFIHKCIKLILHIAFKPIKIIAMKWYNYVACFFAGVFLANVVPHFIHGVSGDSFPTPFANPPGKGLSSPISQCTMGAI